MPRTFALGCPPYALVQEAVRRALSEDLGLAGDITSEACLPSDVHGVTVMRARKHGVIAGLELAVEAFKQVDPSLNVLVIRENGDVITTGDDLLRIEGSARSMLGAERVALNFVQRLSGIATLTAACVQAVSHTKAAITDTRKTTPGLRAFEKYAVRCGGARNHRFGLHDAVLIKDNHIALAGGVRPALERVRERIGHLVMVEIEVDTLDQLEDVLDSQLAHVVLLDNMSDEDMRHAVRLRDKRSPHVLLEASGGITLSSIANVAETGVDLISLGFLTHSAPALDIGLDTLLSS